MVLLLIQPHQHDPQSDSRSSISRLSPVKKSAIEVGMLQMVLLFIQPHQHEPQSDSRSSISTKSVTCTKNQL